MSHNTMNYDTVKLYVMGVETGVRAFCPTCDMYKAVWVGETEGGDTITCCGTCQRIIRRHRTDDIQPPHTNAQPCGCDAAANWTCERHRT